ncbi:hypothetical protein P691DRAFT_770268 [Macrolepiota fuliginosa MF-IS2]|uniref:BZIP transcription factor n=1 Tax=Macrolepiota fuliginosa MF-IS2 TaxID=1400762 RepID=A0A9P5XPV9_9AGAR|nr:hypothetical protein P691DRAFT_770268 [Macrolepiota fuliginosa MF-IS2]
MSFVGFATEEESLGWGAVSAPVEEVDLVSQAIRKEKLIKEIRASQEGLRAMLAKVQNVQKEVDKLSSSNDTLQMYIDNLTKQMAKRR